MTKFFTVEQVIEIHDAFLEDHGGLPGIRDKGLLISAVEMPRASMFGEYLHKTIYDKAAAYLFHLVQNHPFNDGNKRTGALTTILFLEENGVKIAFSEKDYEEFVVNVAQGKRDKDEISFFLKSGKEK
ncbi:MAG: type II toxin-antitoxin system death-on-curing family toxin [Parachlamydiaceae bacterium]